MSAGRHLLGTGIARQVFKVKHDKGMLIVTVTARRNRVSPHGNDAVDHVPQVFVSRFNRWDEICYDIIITHPEEKTTRGIGRVRYA